MSKSLQLGGLIVGLLVLGGIWISGLGGEEPEQIEVEQPVQPEVAGIVEQIELIEVTKVVDGDTIKTEQGTIRLIGIDTPETVDPRKEVQCLGPEASNKLKELLEGQKVRLEKDISDTDRYDRLLRYVYLEDGTFINELMVREGFASASSYPPDIKHQDLFREAEESARSNEWGLWSGICDGEVEGVTTTIEKEVTDTSVKLKINNQVNSNEPIKNEVKVEVKSGQEPKVEVKTTTPKTNCSSNTYNCGDFSSCSEVMAVFNACSSDVHRLDGDDDGVPCESLCG